MKMTIPGLRGEEMRKNDPQKFEEPIEEGWKRVWSKKLEKKKRQEEEKKRHMEEKKRQEEEKKKRQEVTKLEVVQIGPKEEVPSLTEENFPALGVLQKSSVKNIQKPNEARQRQPEEAAVKIAEKSLEEMRLESDLIANGLKVINIRRKKAERDVKKNEEKPEETAVKIAEKSLEEERLDTRAEVNQILERSIFFFNPILHKKRIKAEKNKRQRIKKALRYVKKLWREFLEELLKRQIESLKRLRLPHPKSLEVEIKEIEKQHDQTNSEEIKGWCREQIQQLFKLKPIRGGWDGHFMLKGGMENTRSSSSAYQVTSQSPASCQPHSPTSPNQSSSLQPPPIQPTLSFHQLCNENRIHVAPDTSRRHGSRRSQSVPITNARNRGGQMGMSLISGLLVGLANTQTRNDRHDLSKMTEDMEALVRESNQMVKENEEYRRQKAREKEEKKKKRATSLPSFFKKLKISGRKSKLGTFLSCSLISNCLFCRM